MQSSHFVIISFQHHFSETKTFQKFKSGIFLHPVFKEPNFPCYSPFSQCSFCSAITPPSGLFFSVEVRFDVLLGEWGRRVPPNIDFLHWFFLHRNCLRMQHFFGGHWGGDVARPRPGHGSSPAVNSSPKANPGTGARQLFAKWWLAHGSFSFNHNKIGHKSEEIFFHSILISGLRIFNLFEFSSL